MEPLRHVLWIGGPPASGKTTIAKRLARRHGLRWYSADAHTWEHRDRAVGEGNAAAIRWESLTPAERSAHATPAELFAMSLHYERGPMIVDDLRALPASPLVVAEGSTVQPDVVSSGIADRSRAVWLVPSREFQAARLGGRDVPPEIRDKRNAVYRLLADTIEGDAREHDAPLLVVDGSRGVDEMVTAVAERFAEALAEGPCAETATERRALLRYANDAIVAQVLGYLSRPHTTGDVESFVRAFTCECGDPECDADLEVSVAAFQRAAAAGPVLAASHR